MDYGIARYGVDLRFVEYDIAEIEKRVNVRLAVYFNMVFPYPACEPIHAVYIKNMTYKAIGLNQELFCVVNFHEDYSRFYIINYNPYENNTSGAVGIVFTKCRELDVVKDKKEILEKQDGINKVVEV